MEISYWKSRWEKNNIGFHNPEINSYLIEFAEKVLPTKAKTVFVPLCGKTKDMLWLSNLGLSVIGVEAVEIACIHFFEENNLEYTISKSHGFTIYSSGTIQLWCGSFFSLPSKIIASAEFIYDRASIVALPEKLRAKYIKKLIDESKTEVSMMVHAFTYDQNLMSGPPFSVPFEEISTFYAKHFEIKTLFNESVLKRYERYRTLGLNNLTEQVYHLVKK